MNGVLVRDPPNISNAVRVLASNGATFFTSATFDCNCNGNTCGGTLCDLCQPASICTGSTTCGTCSSGGVCIDGVTCGCAPYCTGRNCGESILTTGSDGCSGSCGR